MEAMAGPRSTGDGSTLSTCSIATARSSTKRTGRNGTRSGAARDVEISPYDPEKNVWIVDADNR